MGIISKALRNSARGRDCTFRTPFCNGDPETVVLCHAPSGTGGMATKGHDYLGAFGCSECHMALDHHKVEDPDSYWLRGIMETWSTWVLDGLISIPVDPATAKRRPGKKANFPKRKIQNGRKLQSRPFQSRKPLLDAQLETEQTGSSAYRHEFPDAHTDT